MFNVVIAKMLGVEEFCSREPHFEDEEVFGSQKHKVNMSLNSKHELYGLDKVNSLVHKLVQHPLELGAVVAV